MGELRVDGNYLVHETGRRSKIYITRKTRNSGQIGDLTAVAKSVTLKEHALNKNLHELLEEPKKKKKTTQQNMESHKSLLMAPIPAPQYDNAKNHAKPSSCLQTT